MAYLHKVASDVHAASVSILSAVSEAVQLVEEHPDSQALKDIRDCLAVAHSKLHEIVRHAEQAAKDIHDADTHTSER